MELGYIGIRKVDNGYVVEIDYRNREDEDKVYVFTKLKDVFNKVQEIFEGEGE